MTLDDAEKRAAVLRLGGSRLLKIFYFTEDMKFIEPNGLHLIDDLEDVIRIECGNDKFDHEPLYKLIG